MASKLVERKVDWSDHNLVCQSVGKMADKMVRSWAKHLAEWWESEKARCLVLKVRRRRDVRLVDYWAVVMVVA